MTREERERIFQDLLPRIRAEAYRAARLFGGSREDLFQESAMEAWRALGAFRTSAGVKPWTYVSNCIRMQLLTEWHKQLRIQRERPSGLIENECDRRRNDQLEQIEFDDLTSVCRERDAEILRLRFVRGCTLREIGNLQGCSMQAIDEYARRGMSAVERSVAA